MKNIEVDSLIQYFEKKLRQRDADNVGAFAGSGPKYPMAVVYLGENTAKVHGAVSDMVTRIWPPYRKELCFLGVNVSGGDFSFFRPEEGTRMEESEVRTDITGLFGTNTHFKDFSRMMIYFVLDTSDVKTKEDFDRQNAAMDWARRRIMAEGQMVMLAVLLNENFEHAESGKMIRNEIGEAMYGPEKTLHADSVFLISNRRNDSAILSDWQKGCRILADLIVLSNGNEAKNTTELFSPNVKTAGYALAEKPSAEIAQVVISYMIEQLNEYRGKKEQSALFEDEELNRKLGLTEEGTLSILDEYGEKSLVPLLPTEEELDMFPRRSGGDGSAAHLSEREFNELTMQAWDAYLGKIISRAETMISEGMALKEQWKREYRELLAASFSADEMIYLADHENLVKKRYKEAREPGNSEQVLRAAKKKLRYQLSSNDTLIEFFMDCLKDEGRRAGEFIEAWSHLVVSLRQTFRVDDESLSNFYKRKTQVYFDKHGHEVARRFTRLGSVDELESFLKELIEQIIQSDPIFAAPFEEELQSRLEASSDPRDARSYIRNELTGDEVKVYLRVNFALEAPVLSTILLKADTSLYQSLRDNLESNIYYYNTGCGDSAEALVTYLVEVTNLVS